MEKKLFYWSDDKGEIAVAVRHAILLAGPCPPAVHTTQTKLSLLDVNLGERTLLQVAAVASPGLVFHGTVIQVFSQIVQGAALHVARGEDVQTRLALGVEHGEAAYIGVVAVLLRTDVRPELVGHLGGRI